MVHVCHSWWIASECGDGGFDGDGGGGGKGGPMARPSYCVLILFKLYCSSQYEVF